MSSGDTVSDTQSELASPNPVSTLNSDQFWTFLRENSEEIVSRILSSAGWSQYIADKDTTIEELRTENRQLQQKLAVTEGTVTRCEQRIQKLEEKVTDLTSRSMRDNIIIQSMDETESENADELEKKVLTILQKDLNIPETTMAKVNVERVHRVGVKKADNKRQVIAKLNSKGKTVVMSHIKNLDKSNPIKICEQFPPEVHANRNKLWPQYVEAKQQGKKARWNVDQLNVEGKIMKPPVDKRRDVNMDVTEEALKLQVRHTAVTSRNNHHLQGHLVEINSVDDVMPALKALYSDVRISAASHIMYAYRVGNEGHSIHNWEDDGEWGGGKKIMDAITGRGVYNQLVCVKKWNGSQFLGPARFDIIKEQSNAAIDLGRDMSSFP
jgi:hypothetical protein